MQIEYGARPFKAG